MINFTLFERSTETLRLVWDSFCILMFHLFVNVEKTVVLTVHRNASPDYISSFSPWLLAPDPCQTPGLSDVRVSPFGPLLKEPGPQNW